VALAEERAGRQQDAVSRLQRHLGGLHKGIAGETDQADFALRYRHRAPFDGNVLSPGDAAEIAMRKDFPKD
jgi:hypothetical protein